MTDFFHAEPIMLRNSTSLTDIEDEKDLIEITQNLAPEQYLYEFPPKSCIMAIEAREMDQEDSFFSESSFTSNSTAAYSNILYEEDEEEQDDCFDQSYPIQNAEQLLDEYLESFNNSDMSFVADHQLSPLQLPTQATGSRIREESYDSTGTIVIQSARPSSFLSLDRHNQYLRRVAQQDRIDWDENEFIFPEYANSESENEKDYRSVHPYYRGRMNSGPDRFYSHADDLVSLSEDDSSNYSCHSKVVVMKLSKSNHAARPTFIHFSPSTGSYLSPDEGYEDEADERDAARRKPMESASEFLPLSDEEQEDMMHVGEHRQLAAVKIQSFWRGCRFRKQQAAHNHSGSLKVPHLVLAGLAHVNDTIHRRNNNQLLNRIDMLEKSLDEETAMRMAFEKAMEDMTVLMDQQHQTLHQRVEQEVNMRQTYERKIEQVMTQVQPLESRLRQESKARVNMESMMSRVLDQLDELKTQSKAEIEQRKSLQRKLDVATEEIALLKKQHTSVRSSSRSTVTTPHMRSSSRLSNKPSPISSPPKTQTSDIITKRQPPSTPSTAKSKPTLTRLSNSTTRSTTQTNTTTRRTIINRKL